VAKYMRQVSKDEYEVLTRFHPGEIRYYVDIDRATKRKQGNPVKIGRSRSLTKPAPKRVVHQRGRSKFVQLTAKGSNGMRPDSLMQKTYNSIRDILQSDPTQVVTRRSLTDSLAAANPSMSRISQIVPTVSGLISRDYLRYSGGSAKVE
jgi:hypothetical protein